MISANRNTLVVFQGRCKTEVPATCGHIILLMLRVMGLYSSQIPTLPPYTLLHVSTGCSNLPHNSCVALLQLLKQLLCFTLEVAAFNGE